MISRKHRFHGYGSLRFVYQHGKTVRGSMTSMKYIENDRRKEYRLSVVVSKKVSKSAVVRNRIRRRLYEAFRRHESHLDKPYDVVLTVFNAQVATLPAEEIEQLVESHLRQARLLKSRPDKLGSANKPPQP